MGRVAVYFEAAAVIISLTLLGQVLELKGTLADVGRDQVALRPLRPPAASARMARKKTFLGPTSTWTRLASAPAKSAGGWWWWSKAAAVDESMLTGEPLREQARRTKSLAPHSGHQRCA